MKNKKRLKGLRSIELVMERKDHLERIRVFDRNKDTGAEFRQARMNFQMCENEMVRRFVAAATLKAARELETP